MKKTMQVSLLRRRTIRTDENKSSPLFRSQSIVHVRLLNKQHWLVSLLVGIERASGCVMVISIVQCGRAAAGLCLKASHIHQSVANSSQQCLDLCIVDTRY